MSKISIVSVNDKKLLNEFIKLPHRIYKNNPHWVPPINMDIKAKLTREKNPFFQHGDITMFLAQRDGEYVGRIAAISNDLHNKVHNDRVGFFGFFESIDDQEVANELFKTVHEFLSKKGYTHMRGPANPSSNEEYGMLLEGFDDSPRLMMPYNPEYYLKLAENYGLKKAKDLYAYKIENEKLLASEKLVRGVDIVRKRTGVTIRNLNIKDFGNELLKVKEVYNNAWAPNYGFVPMTEEELDDTAKSLKPLLDPNIVLFAEKDGETIGFALVMPNYNEVFKDMNGKLFPTGIFKLLTRKKKIKWARILILGLLPKYQKKGIDALFYYEIAKRAEKRGILLGEASWILEDNEMMIRGAELMNGTLYKKYRIYEINI
ncbi:MAG: hypothetical protein ACEPO8_11700 [Rhodothermaceae bacterium]